MGEEPPSFLASTERHWSSPAAAVEQVRLPAASTGQVLGQQLGSRERMDGAMVPMRPSTALEAATGTVAGHFSAVGAVQAISPTAKVGQYQYSTVEVVLPVLSKAEPVTFSASAGVEASAAAAAAELVVEGVAAIQEVAAAGMTVVVEADLSLRRAQLISRLKGQFPLQVSRKSKQ